MDKFDLADSGVRALNQALHQDDAAGKSFTVTNPGGKHNVAAGAIHDSQVEINGHVGYYCAGMNKNADIVINGNAGIRPCRKHDVRFCSC